MGCGCKDKKAPVLPTPERHTLERLTINCPGCGVMRLIPEGSAEFQLVPCPRCGVPFSGRLVGSQVEELR